MKYSEQLLDEKSGTEVTGIRENSAEVVDNSQIIPRTVRPELYDGHPLSESIQWYAPPRRPYSRRELLADRLVNFAGAGAAWLATFALAYESWSRHDPHRKQVFFWFHGAGLITMLNCSAFYHYLAWDWRYSEQLLTLDHVGISAMIVGCYAPVMQYCACYQVFAFVCILGAAVLPLEAIRLWQISRQKSVESATTEQASWSCVDILHIVRYLVMGWAVLAVVPTVIQVFPVKAMCGTVVGGLLYTSGVVVFVRQKLEFHLAIWHGMVLLASIIFYLSNLLFLVGTTSPLETAATA